MPILDLTAPLTDHDVPIAYMQRTREYYLALGYGNPYHWAHFRDVPFTRLTKPLREARVAIVTTAAPFQPDNGDQGPGAAYNAAVKFFKAYSMPVTGPCDLRISHIAYDRTHTSAADQRTWFPLEALQWAVGEGRVGSLATHFHGVPTNRSQATTIAADAPDIVARCRADGVDAALLVPNCPVCHQVTAITARFLEAAGIATVVVGAAKDIVEHCGVPRFLFNDYPLGSACGRPDDVASQRRTLALALDLLAAASGPRTTLQSPERWSDDASWKLDYMNVERMSADEIARRRTENDRGKALAKDLRAEVGLLRTSRA